MGAGRSFDFNTMALQWLNYLKLTKPKIMLLVLAAGTSALLAEGSMLANPGRFTLFLLGLFLTGGCANALNQYFERTIDARMIRTAGKRPLPLGSITPWRALAFSVFIGLAGIILLAVIFNLITGFLALATILFYGLVYTLWLKPRSAQNIVIGGIAGAMAPVGAWTAATGSTALLPWIIFLLIFFWTPPHFWSLALCFKDDYIKVKLPMMPVVKGDKKTLDFMSYYSILTAAVSLIPLFANFSWIYLGISSILGAILIYKSFLAKNTGSRRFYWGFFKFSIIYLFAILAAIAIAGRL
jgi:protoheme IX farnesyltransferase